MSQEITARLNMSQEITARLMQDPDVESETPTEKPHYYVSFDYAEIVDEIRLKKRIKERSIAGRMSLAFMRMLSCFKLFLHYNIVIMLMNLICLALYITLIVSEK